MSRLQLRNLKRCQAQSERGANWQLVGKAQCWRASWVCLTSIHLVGGKLDKKAGFAQYSWQVVGSENGNAEKKAGQH